MRREEGFAKGGTRVLIAPEQDSAAEKAPRRRGAAVPRKMLRPNFDEDFSELEGEPGGGARRRGGVKVKFRLGLPRSRAGWIAVGVGVVVVAGVCVAAGLGARKLLLADDRFVIPSSSAIEIQGNKHLTHAQLLSIFGEDVERSVFQVSLAERKEELERLPWVQRATVMRLLPDHLRVSITERTPVAFARDGSKIDLVDAGGVLLNMPGDDGEKYSFPVLTGISAGDPLSTRAARMKLYKVFTTDLDSDGEKISEKLSEVDLSNPEDVRAVIPGAGGEVLVHFGDTDFLERYKKFQDLLPAWRAQYPKLASVDMRYDKQAVLEMQPGSAVPVGGTNGSDAASAKSAESVKAGTGMKAATAPVSGVTTAKKSGSTASEAHGVAPKWKKAPVKPAKKAVAPRKQVGKQGGGRAAASKLKGQAATARARGAGSGSGHAEAGVKS